MAGFNTHHYTEEQPQVSSLEDQLRLREEIERQLEVERESAYAMAQDKLAQEQRKRQAMARALQQEEELRQFQTSSTQTSQRRQNRRSYGMDALLLCAVTLGMGALLGPIVRPAPPMYYPMVASGPITPMPAMGLMRAPFEWSDKSIDVGGNDWSGSRMTFDREVTMSNGRAYVEGHADWNMSGEYVGSEQFSGSYDPATGKLDVVGTSIEQPNLGMPARLVPGEYTATIGADGQMVNGYMQGAPNVSAIPGPFGGSQMAP